jgi:hypothetical protein
MILEQAVHGDIVFLPKPVGASEGKDSALHKTLALVEWLTKNATSSPFVLKTDDDAYVHTANLVEALQKVKFS